MNNEPRVAGILVQDVVYLVASLDDAFFAEIPAVHGIRGCYSYEEHGLKFTVMLNDGLIKTYSTILGLGWTVYMEFSSHVQTKPSPGSCCMDRRGSWQILTDWSISGDELRFCSDMTKAKLFGLV